MMWAPPLPMTRARSTNIRSFTDSVCDRMIRAVDAQLVIADDDDDDQSVARMPATWRVDADDVEDDRGQDDGQDERRQDEEEVGDAHQERVGPPADEAGRRCR